MRTVIIACSLLVGFGLTGCEPTPIQKGSESTEPVSVGSLAGVASVVSEVGASASSTAEVVLAEPVWVQAVACIKEHAKLKKDLINLEVPLHEVASKIVANAHKLQLTADLMKSLPLTTEQKKAPYATYEEEIFSLQVRLMREEIELDFEARGTTEEKIQYLGAIGEYSLALLSWSEATGIRTAETIAKSRVNVQKVRLQLDRESRQAGGPGLPGMTDAERQAAKTK